MMWKLKRSNRILANVGLLIFGLGLFLRSIHIIGADYFLLAGATLLAIIFLPVLVRSFYNSGSETNKK